MAVIIRITTPSWFIKHYSVNSNKSPKYIPIILLSSKGCCQMCPGGVWWGGWVDLTVIIGLVLVQLALYCKLELNCQLAPSLTKLLQYFNVKLKKKKVLLQPLLSWAQLSPNLCALINFDRNHRTVTFHFNIDFFVNFN